MRYKQLGHSGLIVSELWLGTMTFGGKGYWANMGTLGSKEVDTLVGHALDAGVNCFDTADAYSEGEAERLLGNALKDVRQQVVIASKAFYSMGAGVNEAGLSRKHLIDAVEGSLKRLGTDYIDLFQIHAYDPLTPMEETLRALDDLVRSGKVRYVGCCNLASWHIMKALGLSRENGFVRFESTQSHYNVVTRDLERDIIPLAEDQKLGVLVWGGLAGGLLSGKFRPDAELPAKARRTTFDFPPVDKERAYTVVDIMDEIAQENDCTVACIALAWLLHQPAVTGVLMGAKTLAQLVDNLQATTITLTETQLARLAEVSEPRVEYPHWQIARQSALRMAKLSPEQETA